MSNVIPLHQASASKARGVAIATAIMATRYGLDGATAESLGAQAARMVERGHSAARARQTMLNTVRRMARPVVA